MRKVVKFVLGLSVIAASLASATPASATRWVNRDMSHGTFFMGVAGGCVNTPIGCSLVPGTRIIVWQPSNDGKNHTDQNWMVPGVDATRYFGNELFSTTPQLIGLSIQGSSTANGAAVVVRDIPPCCATADQTWQIIKAEDLQAPFWNCFVIKNNYTGKVAGVAGGTVTQGASVIQWPLFMGQPLSPTGWHPDQFWCPTTDITFP
jgi:hypothetical protein